jgi:hypothetical protein
MQKKIKMLHQKYAQKYKEPNPSAVTFMISVSIRQQSA